jgi:hypothetical protein
MAGMLRVPRSRGAISGLLLVLLGIWGGLVIFVGPSLGYGYTPDRTWAYSTDRLYMVILPAAATFLGGLMALLSANRATAAFGGWLAALGGAWFVVGGPLSPIWAGRNAPAGVPLGLAATQRAVEQIGIFTGLGVVIVFLAALSLGRFTVRGAREAAAAEAEGTMAEPTGSSRTAETAGYHAGRTGSPDTTTTEFERPVLPTDTHVASTHRDDTE